MWRPEPEDGRLLLGLSRAAIAHVLAVPGPDPERLLGEALERTVLRRPAPAFVTLRIHRELRGCLGTLETEEPLARAVARHAVAAALHDPRFPPLLPDEVVPVRLGVSVLGPLTPVPSPEAIVLGRHGVALAHHGRRGVFLPEVAPEQGWDVPTLLEHLAVKAGLRRTDWQDGDLSIFETVSFAEGDGTDGILRGS